MIERMFDDSKRIRYFLLFAIISLFLYGGLIKLLIISLQIEELKASMIATMTYTFGISMLLLFLYFGEIKKSVLSFNVKSLGWVLGGAVAVYVLQACYGLVYQLLYPITDSANGNALKETLTIFPLYVLVTSIFMPFIEEMFFRKMMFGFLKKWIGFISASVTSSILFAMVHFDPTNFILFLLIGMFLTYVYDQTNNIIVPVLIHSIINSTILLFSII